MGYGTEIEIAFEDAKQTIVQQQARIAELEKDAARYRWLRDSGNGGRLSIGKQLDVHDEYPAYEQVDWLYDEQLDAAIDAAMQER